MSLLAGRRSQLEELINTAVSVLFGMWRFRRIALVLAWMVSLAGWVTVSALPDSYEATTRFYINAESMTKRVVRDLAISGDAMTEVNILTRAMLSRPQLEKTARLADLDLAVRTPEEHERFITNLATRVKIQRGGDNIFQISFVDSNRAVAETVVRTLLDTFVEDALGERRDDSGAATEFIDQQITEYERRLNEAEERLANFKRDNIGLMPGETGDYYTRLQRSMQVVEETRAELRLANERRLEYQQQLEGEEPVFGVVTPSSTVAGQPGANDALISQYEKDLSSLLLKYTDNHPDVVALKETIQRLKSQQQEDAARTPQFSSTPSAGPLETNPVYQRMRMGLSETNVEIATLRTKLAEEEATVKQLQNLVNTIPEIERKLTALNRDYDVTRQQYEVLLKRRESLHITGEVEQTGDQLQFRPIDPPRASLDPIGPNRTLFLAGSTIFAIGVGVVIAFLLQQLNPVFGSRHELRQVTGLPVLGVVSLSQSPDRAARARKRTWMFAAVGAALPAMLVVAILVQTPAHRAVTALLSVALP